MRRHVLVVSVRLSLLAALVAGVSLVSAKPDRVPSDPPSEPPAPPRVAGEYSYGHLCQDGRRVAMNTHAWRVEGWFLDDGRLRLVWTPHDGDASSVCIGVYKLDENMNLVGRYGYHGKVSDRAGELCGQTFEETLWRKKGPE